MQTAPILVDGEERDTGDYVLFPDMDKVIAEPGLAIALQMQSAAHTHRLVFSYLPQLIPSSSAEMMYLRDYRKHHGTPKYTKDELDDIVYAKISQAREIDIAEAIRAGSRDHLKLFNPFSLDGQGVTLDNRIDALFEALTAVRNRSQEVRDITVREGTPASTFDWTWDMFTEYLEKHTFELWGEELDVREAPGRDGGRNYQLREPFGVSCLFTPYNAPLALGILSITSSILAGNATILKPPSKVPLSTILLGRSFMRTFLDMDLPAGMLQLLNGGGKPLMRRFMHDDGVNAIVWYGDSDRGFDIWADAVNRRVQMAPELAGSDACLVWGNDLDLESVAKLVVRGRFLGSGQACLAIKRLLVQNTLFHDLLRLLIEEAEKLNVGRPSDPSTDLPPVGLTALYLLLDQMRDALAKGAEVRTGGSRCNYLDEDDPAGLFYRPTILTNVNLDMRIMNEEVFAPALPILTVDRVETAIAIANSTRFGLRSSLFTNEIELKRKWAKEIQAGGVTIMQDHLYFDPHMPHLGGYKDSGIIGAKYFPVMLTRMKYIHTGPGSELV
ncbi:MAG: aldehyde dehydrogenase family protein [Candidatus Thorarchaeota archaeon]|nr:MAG: aldehyde dehydrogenase family protein [Candidatus Thorarchaeota archaeon]